MKPRLMQPIVIALQPSVLLLGLLAAISIASSPILAQLQVLIFIKLGSIVLVLISSAYFAMREALLRLPSSWKSQQVNVQGMTKLKNNRGENID